MKKQKTQSKIIVALTAVVILLVAVSATLTFAYFTATSSNQSSSMTFGTLSIDTEELASAPGCTHAGTAASLSTLVPGCTITLGDTDAITVSGNIDALLRATLTVTAYQKCDANGVPYTAENIQGTETTGVQGVAGYKIDNGNVVSATNDAEFYAKMTTKNQITNEASTFAETIFNSIQTVSNWTYNTTDNRYYYNKVVNAGGATADVPFQTTIVLARTLGNEWQGAIMKIGIVVDAIQAQHLINSSNKNIVITADSTNGNVITGVTVDSTSAGNAMADWIAAIATASAWTVDMQTGV